MNKIRRFIVMGLVIAMTVGLCACSAGSEKEEASINTVQNYQMSEEEWDIVNLVDASGEGDFGICQFAIDETYKYITVGYDVYEKGILVKKNNGEMQVPVEYESKPQSTYGRIGVTVRENSISMNVIHAGEDDEEQRSTGSIVSENSLKKYESSSMSELGKPVSVKAGEKIYFSAEIRTTGDDVSFFDIEEMMQDGETMKSYDSCYVFYVRFDKSAK